MTDHIPADPMCMRCRQRKSAHTDNGTGGFLCPPVKQYFLPCDHKNRIGSGSIYSDGTAHGESTCQDCFERFAW